MDSVFSFCGYRKIFASSSTSIRRTQFPLTYPISRLTCLIWDVWDTKVELQTSLSKKIFTVIILHGIICIIHTEYV